MPQVAVACIIGHDEQYAAGFHPVGDGGSGFLIHVIGCFRILNPIRINHHIYRSFPEIGRRWRHIQCAQRSAIQLPQRTEKTETAVLRIIPGIMTAYVHPVSILSPFVVEIIIHHHGFTCARFWQGSHFHFHTAENESAHALRIVHNHRFAHVILKTAIAVGLAPQPGNTNRSFQVGLPVRIHFNEFFDDAIVGFLRG